MELVTEYEGNISNRVSYAFRCDDSNGRREEEKGIDNREEKDGNLTQRNVAGSY